MFAARSFRLGIVVLLGAMLQYAALESVKSYQALVAIEEARIQADRLQFSAAEAAASRAIDLDPMNGYGWFQLAMVDYLRRKYPETVEHLNRGIATHPHFGSSIRMIGMSYYLDGKYEEAAKYLGRYLELTPQPAVTPDLVFRMAALSSLRDGQLVRSSYEFGQAIRHTTDKLEAKADFMKIRAMISVLLNLPDSAHYFFLAFHHMTPNAEFKTLELVNNAIASNKVPVAVKFLQLVQKENPTDLSLVVGLALAYKAEGNFEKSESLLLDTIAKNPEYADLYLVYGTVLYDQKKFQEAFIQYDKHLNLNPDSTFRTDILHKKATSR